MRTTRRVVLPAQAQKVMAGERDVSQCIAVERADERAQSFVQHAGQTAVFCDGALVAGNEAFDKPEIGLGRAHHGSEIDVLRRLRQRESTGSASDALDVAGARQDVDHLHQMGARDAVGLGGLLDGNEAVADNGRIDEHAESII